MRSLGHTVRSLLRAPGFTVVAVLTLALGIGAATAIVSVVEGVLLRPLPYPEPDRLVVLRETHRPAFPGSFVRPETFADWRREARAFSHLALIRDGIFNLTGAGEPAPLLVGRTTASTFATLGVAPALGRDFRAEEEQPGRGGVVVLSHGFWQRQLGGTDVLGRTLSLDGQPFEVVGVMPPGFQPGRPFDLFTPGYGPRRDESANQFIEVLGRLAPGVTLAQARDEMARLTAHLAARDPRRYQNWGVDVQPLHEERVGQARPALLVLLGAVGFLLLIACANVANLLLARATVRARELAVRSALGASRGRLARQWLAESLLLALAGGLLGVGIAWLGMKALLAAAPQGLPRAAEIAVDGRALAVALALSLVTAIVFGLAPAWRASGAAPGDSLREGAASPGRRPQRLRGALVVLQVAVAVVLLVGAGLLARSFARLQSFERGFRPEGASTFSLTLPESRFAGPAAQVAFTRGALDRLAAVPGVSAAGAVQRLPFAGSLMFIHVQRVGHAERGARPPVNWYAVTPDYFSAMGIRLVRGRAFGWSDGAGRAPVTIISESLARHYFPGQDPIGQRIAAAHRPEVSAEIVGVVSDVRDEALTGRSLQAYGSFAQDPYAAVSFVVRSAGPAGAAIREAIRGVDPHQAVTAVRPLGDLVARSIARERFAALVLAVFSGAALLLAAVGLHGLLAYTLAQRRAELGLRRALGARTAHVLALVLRQGGALVALGLILGVAGAALLALWLPRVLFGIGAHDPLTYAGALLVLGLAAAAACVVPAVRALRVAPMTALRGPS